MKIALPFENENIFPHFGNSADFKIYEIENSKITKMRFVSVDDGRDAVIDFLCGENINVLICDAICQSSVALLRGNGIAVIEEVRGNADVAVRAFLDGTLTRK